MPELTHILLGLLLLLAVAFMLMAFKLREVFAIHSALGEKIADTFGHYHKRMDGTSDTLGDLDGRLRRIEDLAMTAAATISAPAVDVTQGPGQFAEAKPAVLKLTPCSAMSNAEVMEALKRIQTMQGELIAKGVKFTYHVTFPS